ncbi:MAG: hypothetical protein QM771_08730 [Nitrospira sp.]
MKKMIAVALLSVVIASPAWALFETNKQLAATATVTLEDAVKHASQGGSRQSRGSRDRETRWPHSL